jgi:hypothetical protein
VTHPQESPRMTDWLDYEAADGHTPAEEFWRSAGFAYDTADRRWSLPL